MKLKVTLLLLALSNLLYSQNEDSNFRLEVLNKNIIGKEYTFGKWDKDGEETHLTYLGNVKTKKGLVFKIMNSVWIWGMSGGTTARILVFNEKNQYIGNYRLFDSCDLPTEIKNGYLIINNVSEGCDRKIEIKININNGLPKSILGYNFES